MTNGWSAMGFAIPAAIAAKLTKPELPVCAVVGDGGFLMTAGELAVAVRLINHLSYVVTHRALLCRRWLQQVDMWQEACRVRVTLSRDAIGGYVAGVAQLLPVRRSIFLAFELLLGRNAI